MPLGHEPAVHRLSGFAAFAGGLCHLPSQDTCEQCHWPQKFISDKLRVVKRYDEDEKSTEKTTVLLMHIGTRIHKAHVARHIEYVSADPARQETPWLSVDGGEYKTGEPVGETQEARRFDRSEETRKICFAAHQYPSSYST